MIRLLACIACLAMVLPASALAKVPKGFEDTRLTGFDGSMSLAFTPDGSLLIAGRTGQLRLFRDGVLSRPAIDLRPKLCWDAERGMVGLAVDPGFAANGYLYLYYTYDRYGTARNGDCPENTRRTPVNRVSRFRLGANDLVDPASERVLIDNIPSFGGNHNAGDLGFGNDGYLYVSVGDGGCDYARDSGCYDSNDAARDRHVLLGKILRITRNGGIPASNPFRGRHARRCARTGSTAPGKICEETYALGLRNPFRFAFDPAARGTRFFINDTGEHEWEEIDLGAPGADYGWNVREGHCRTSRTKDCGSPAGMTNPIFDYPHSRGCGVITGGAFVPPGIWPGAYRGGYLFSDFKCGKVMLRKPGARRAVDFASRKGPIIDLVFGPHGSSQALYYTTWDIKGNSWEVHRISARPADGDPSFFSRCGGNVGTSLILLGLCGVPYLRRRRSR